MRIVRLEARNIKRLRAVGIDIGPGVNVIAGRNGQGKSSVLDAVQIALGGKKEQPQQPVRHGASKAYVVVETDEFKATRRWTRAGNQVLEVEAKGEKVKGPQDFLASVVGELSFDPLRFMHAEPKRQAETLRAMAGLDFCELDAKRAALYETRRDANAAVKSLSAMLEGKADPTDIKAVDTRKLAADVEESGRAAVVVTRLEDQVAAYEKEILHLEKRITELRGGIMEVGGRLNDARKLAGLYDGRIAALAAATENNRLAERAEETRVLIRRLNSAKKTAADLDDQIDAIDDKKRGMIADAKYPIDGLAVDGDTVTFGGVPVEQCSQAERIRISAAIGMATSKDLRVMLIRDGSLLDDDSMALLAALAEERDYQILVERVVDDTPGRIIIEDGAVVGAEDVAEDDEAPED